MKIIFFELEVCDRLLFEKAFTGDELIFIDQPLIEKVPDNARDADIISIFVHSIIDEGVLEKFNKLQLIVTRSTGTDHIALRHAHKRNICVAYAPGYADVSVAEYTLALLLTLSRRICESYSRVKNEHFFSVQGLQGFQLYGKTLGVIGTGRIGKHVIQLASCFGMCVIAYDVNKDLECEKKFNCKYVDLNYLFAHAEIISFHVPLNNATRHMICDAVLPYLKPGVFIINTSRGEIINTHSLIKGLEQGIVAGAALDVLQEEEFMADPLLLLAKEYSSNESLKHVLANRYLVEHPRVIVTPHNAFNTKEALEILKHITIETIQSWQQKRPKNLVPFT